jgi:hypothetical protein
MSEIPISEPNINPTSCRVYLEDFNDSDSDSDDCCVRDYKSNQSNENNQNNQKKYHKNKYHKHYSQNDYIAKNQQEFGHKKRIKP